MKSSRSHRSFSTVSRKFRKLLILWIISKLSMSTFNLHAEEATLSAEGVSYGTPNESLEATIPFNEKEILVDGVIDEQEWLAASAFTGFMDNTRRGYSTHQTVVYASYGPDHLNLAFESPAPQGSDKDRLMISLKPEAHVYALAIDTKGTMSSIGPTSLGKGVETKSVIKDGKWICEVRLPYGVFSGGKFPQDGVKWSANFGRFFGEPLADTSWGSKTLDDPFSIVEKEMGQLVFKKECPYVKVFSLGALDRKQMWVKGTIYEKSTSSQKERKRAYLSNMLFLDGTREWHGRDIWYTPGELSHFAIGPGPGLEHDKLDWPYRPCNFVAFDIHAGSYNSRDFLQRTKRFPVGKSFEPLSHYSHKVLPGNIFLVWLETLGIPSQDVGKLTLKASMTSPTGKVLEQKELKGVMPGELGVEFKADLLGVGFNQFKAVLVDSEGRKEAEVEQVIEKPDASLWVGNKIGISEQVPPPFEPIQKKGDSILCWGRDYLLKDGILSQIKTRGKAILAAPVSMEAKSGGENLSFQSSSWKFEEVKDTLAVVKKTLSSPQLDLEVKETIEFDGMIRFDITLKPKSTRVENLVLKVPIKEEHAKYLNWTRSAGSSVADYADRRANRKWDYGALPEEGFQGDFRPFLWLGDDDRGLLWFAEGMENWNIKRKNQVLKVEKKEGVVELQVTMIDRPTKFDRPSTITFGLQASPVRPLPPQWRNFGKKLVSYGSYDRKLSAYNLGLVKAEAEKIREKTKDGRKVILYTFPFWINSLSPAYVFFANEWKDSGPLTRTKELPDYDVVSLRTGFKDYAIWMEAEAFKVAPYKHAGLYYDMSCPLPSTHPKASYKDLNGEIQPRWEIFQLRDYYKRVYTFFRQQMKETYFIAHSSANTFQFPLLSFSDATYDGEQYAHWVRDYIKEVPLDEWRAMFTRRQFGTVPLFIAELRYWEPGEAEVRASYTLATMIFLHDIIIYHGSYNYKVFEPFEKLKDDFGVAESDVNFIPYWESEKIFRSGNSNLLVSAYVRPGKALLVAGNLSDTSTEEEIAVDFKALGVKPETVKIHDGESLQTTEVKDGKIKTKIQGKHPVFITIN